MPAQHWSRHQADPYWGPSLYGRGMPRPYITLCFGHQGCQAPTRHSKEDYHRDAESAELVDKDSLRRLCLCGKTGGAWTLLGIVFFDEASDPGIDYT